MDAFMEKLGIYDLIAVFMTGLIVSIISMVIDTTFIKSELNNFMYIDDKIVFLAISYFIGILLQEASSLIYRGLIFKNDKLLDQVFEVKNTLGYYISEKEIKKLKCLVSEKVSNSRENDNTFIYNMCKANVLKEGNTRISMDQAMAGLSRSLSLYFFLLTLVMLYLLFARLFTQQNINYYLVSAVVDFLISTLLFFRYKRFTKMRYSNILRAYLYFNID